jgi:hypothetical protein
MRDREGEYSVIELGIFVDAQGRDLGAPRADGDAQALRDELVGRARALRPLLQNNAAKTEDDR